jgi:hypothetical protein
MQLLLPYLQTCAPWGPEVVQHRNYKQESKLCVILGFRREVDENWVITQRVVAIAEVSGQPIGL